MIKVNVGEWKSAWHEPPTKDGKYLIVLFSDCDGSLLGGSILEYTVEHGWNTTPYNNEYSIDFTGRSDVWTTLKREGDKTNEILETLQNDNEA